MSEIQCSVHLDRVSGQYFSGDEIIGTVSVNLPPGNNAKGITVTLRGKEHTEWTVEGEPFHGTDGTFKSRIVEYTGDNKFLELQTTLTQEGELLEGQHEYPFSFALPRDIPGTYYSKYGYIKFYVKATVIMHWGRDFESKQELKIMSPINLNDMQGLPLAPTVYSDDVTNCCCCCASLPITMKVFLDKEAYVPGETIRIRVEISNLADVRVYNLEAKFRMVIESKTTRPSPYSKYYDKEIAASIESGVDPHKKRTYEIELKIPKSFDVPNFNLSTLFSHKASLSVKPTIGGLTDDMLINVPITLGHISNCTPQCDLRNMSLPPSAYPVSSPSPAEGPNVVSTASASTAASQDLREERNIVASRESSTLLPGRNVVSTASASTASIQGHREERNIVANRESTTLLSSAPPSYDDAMKAHPSSFTSQEFQ